MEATNTAPEAPEEVDAWTARFARVPVGQVPIDVLCLTEPGSAGIVESASVIETVRRKGRLGKIIPVFPDSESPSWGDAITLALAEVSAPLVVISEARAEWNRDILERLLKTIDMCDVALGARPCPSRAARIARTLASMGRGLFWGAGVYDPLTPYKLARTEILRKFPIQSTSRFAEVEFIAKANFLDALIHEEVLPVAESWTKLRFGAGARADRRNLFKSPVFCHAERHSGEDEPNEISSTDSGTPERLSDVRTLGSDGSTDA
ncbi:hypothetical protein GC170_02525 [bacterium]|nr:hypothetical protein [bacterium]